MDLVKNFSEMQKKLLEKSSSPEYQYACQHYKAESLRLLKTIRPFLEENVHKLTANEMSAVRKAYASGSDLHRGFYCPCPVYELIVGNTHRGKLLKRITARSKPTHAYGFDDDNQLLWAKRFHDGKQASIEHLIYDGNKRYGITVDSSNRLNIITEEVFDGKQLTHYTNFLCTQFEDSFLFGELNAYEYRYDEQGLCAYVWNSFTDPANIPSFAIHNAADSDTADFFSSLRSMPPLLRRSEIVFNRENGYIVSYTSNGYTYIPRTAQKA